MGTLLTDPTSPEIDAETQRRERVIDQARCIIEIYLQGYKEGDVTYAEMFRVAKQAVRLLGEGHRERILGQLADAAPVEPPPRRARRGMPQAMRRAVAAVVDRIAEAEQLSKIADGDLWERTSEVFAALGFTLSARQAATCYYGK